MKHTQLLIAGVLNSPVPSKCSWTNCDKIIDDNCTNSYILNSWVTGPNLTKFLHDVDTDHWLTCWNRNCDIPICYYLLRGDTSAPSGLYARLCHAFLVSHFSRCCTNEPRDLWGYWTEDVHHNQLMNKSHVIKGLSEVTNLMNIHHFMELMNVHHFK